MFDTAESLEDAIDELQSSGFDRAELPADDVRARALLNPPAVFDEPKEVLRREHLTREQKIPSLRRWEYDARELETAADEVCEASPRTGLIVFSRRCAA